MSASSPAIEPEKQSIRAHSSQVGLTAGSAWLIGLIAFGYPLISSAERMAGNTLKYQCLATIASILGVQLFFHLDISGLLRKPSPWIRSGMSLVAVLVVYTFLLCGVTVETLVISLLFPIVFLIFFKEVNQTEGLNKPILRLLLGYAAAVLIACYFTHHQYAAIVGHPYRHTGLSTLLSCLTLFWAAATLLANDGIRRAMLSLLLASGALASAVALVQFFSQGDWVYRFFPQLREDPRAYGTLGHPNWFGTFLMLVIPFATHVLLKERRWIWRLLLAILHASLLVCQTRGAWLAETSLLAFTCFQYRRQPFLVLEVTCIITVVTALLLPVQNWKILTRADSLTREAAMAAAGSASAGTGRFGFWKYGLSHLPEHAVLGAGLDSFDAMATNGEPVPVDKAHSIYLDQGLSTGLIGLGCYLGFLWLCFWKHAPAEYSIAFRGLFVAYLVQGLFIHDTIQTWPLLWILAGMAVSPIWAATPIQSSAAETAKELAPQTA